MYEARYGTDWESLDHDAVVERAFALGVDAALGEPDETEYHRLVDALDAYGESLVQLAYREGRSEALDLRQGASSDAVWATLVEGDADGAFAAEESGPPGPAGEGLPSFVDRLGALDPPEVASLPAFLREG